MLYIRALNINTSSYLFDRVLNIPRFQIFHSSEYIRVLDMSGFIKKTLHHIHA